MDLNALSNLLFNVGSPPQYLVQALGVTAVYHYTDLAALQSIVTNSDLWLTNARFSNDYEEGTYGARIARTALAEFMGDQSRAQPERDFARSIDERFGATPPADVYICCFCRQDNLLRQWRSYGSNATGVSLEVATTQFQQLSGPDLPNHLGLMYLWRVFYEEDKQRKIVKECVSLAYANTSKSLDERIELALDAVRFFIPTFKNAAFHDELEARLVFRPAPTCPIKPDFRVARGMLVPYYSIRKLAAAANQGGWRPPITSVRIGPNPNREINREGVKLMLRSSDYDGPVEVSDAPYRA